MRPTAIPILVASILAPNLLGAQTPVEGLISVSGEATVRRAPDQAIVSLGVQSQATEASEAQRETNRIAGAILDSLGELGIEAGAIRTSSLQLHPIYEARPPAQRSGEPQVAGYRATNTVAVTLEDLEAIGPVIDHSIAAGANRVDSVDLRLEDDSEARRQALSAAVIDARAKAQAIAEALGGRLGPVFDVQEGGISAPPIVYRQDAARSMAAMEGAPTPVATGSLTISASVTVRYRLGE